MLNELKEEIQDAPQKLILLLITLIVAIVIVTIVALLWIWSPANSNNYVIDNTIDEIGYYQSINITADDIIGKYTNNVFNKFYLNDTNEIYSLFSKEYIDFNKLNKISLYNKLDDKGLLKEALFVTKYIYSPSTRNGRIYEVEVSNDKGNYNDKFIIIEKNINHYSVSLDNFISSVELSEEYVTEGLKLTLNKRTEYVTKLIYDISITNVTDNDMILNYNNEPESSYIGLNDGTEIRTSSIWFGSSKKTLDKGDSLNAKIEFNINNLEGGIVDTFILKNVYDTVSEEKKDIQFLSFN